VISAPFQKFIFNFNFATETFPAEWKASLFHSLKKWQQSLCC
jgi:hypothetical protein